MGMKDSLMQQYMRDVNRFADLCNYALFNGDEVIKPENLEIQDTVEIFVSEKADVAQKLMRDVLKKLTIGVADDVVIALIGIENQDKINYAMPVRSMVYDALNYYEQVKECRNRHIRDGEVMDGAEFLSMGKNDKLKPVVTIVLYWGKEEWCAPRRLHETFSCSEGGLMERVLKFVPDYTINLVEINKIDDFSKLRTSLGEAFKLINALRNRTLKKYAVPDNGKNLVEEDYNLVFAITGENVASIKKEGVAMGSAIQELIEEVEERTRREVEERTRREVEERTQRETVSKLLLSGINASFIVKNLNYSLEFVEDVRNSLDK